jgi:hypothetical protein
MSRLGFALSLSLLLVSGVGAEARAGEAALPDTAVTTRDGAVYQGVLVEQIPGDHVSIQTADGRIRSFAAADVTTVRPLGPRNPAPPGGGRGVMVDLVSADPAARLWQMSVSGGAPAVNPEMCGLPCGLRVPAGTYVVAGNGVLPSDPFELRESAGRVRIKADTVTHDRRTVGIGLAAGGGITAGSLSLPLWLLGVLLESSAQDSPSTFPDQQSERLDRARTVKWTGIVLTALCVAASAAGLAVYHGGTKVEIDEASR